MNTNDDQPDLSNRPNPYDRGEVLEPYVWLTGSIEDRFGRVDFDDDEAVTRYTVQIRVDQENGIDVVDIGKLTETPSIVVVNGVRYVPIDVVIS